MLLYFVQGHFLCTTNPTYLLRDIHKNENLNNYKEIDEFHRSGFLHFSKLCAESGVIPVGNLS